MKCTVCNGLTNSITMHDASFNSINAIQCLNCGRVTYPKFTPLPLKSDKQTNRKGIPTMFIHKKGVTNGK